MSLTQMRFLMTARINRIIGTLAAELEIKRPLNFLARLPLVPAYDDELIGRFTGKILAADIVADDQEAVVNESMQLELFTHAIPNVKHGQRLGQKMLNRIKQLEAQPTVQGENALADWEMSLAENLLTGIRQRQNAMACSMMLDTFTYSRFGVQILGASWGMPANLKVTTGTAWAANPTTATPLSDLWAIDQVARLAYGIEYDTWTMGTADFRAMTATTEFANKATLTLGAAFLLTGAAIDTKNDPKMLQLAQQVSGKTIVLDDTTYNEKSAAGTVSTTRVLPANKVLLSRREDENNGRAYDFANGVVTESIVADLVGGAPDGIGGDQYGPIAYYAGRPDLNPPDVSAWAVARCFPRKFVPECTAVLTTA
jgi:hypothetical protein